MTDASEAAVERMARAMYDEPEHLRHGGATWEDGYDAVRIIHRGLAMTALAALLADPEDVLELLAEVRVPCPDAGHRVYEVNREGGGTVEVQVCSRDDCTDGSVPFDIAAVLGFEQVGWLAPTHTREFGYVLNVEPIESTGEQPVYARRPSVSPKEPDK